MENQCKLASEKLSELVERVEATEQENQGMKEQVEEMSQQKERLA